MAAAPNQLAASLPANFNTADYRKWERQSRKGKGVKHTGRKSSLPPVQQHGSTPLSAYTVSTTTASGKASPTITRTCATTPFCKKQKKKTVRTDPSALHKEDSYRMLQVQIKSKKQMIAEYEAHCAALQEANMRLAAELDTKEGNAVVNAREFLVQYERLGSHISAFSEWSSRQIKEKRADLEDKESMAQKDCDVLAEQLKGMMSKVRTAHGDLYTLKTYKDKKYPVKSLRIAELQQEINKLKETHEDEKEDIEMLAQSERDRLEKLIKNESDCILSGIAERKMSYVPAGIKEMAFHNTVMKKEIEIHKRVAKKLEEKNLELEENITHLLQNKKDIRMEIFNILPKSKCTPDMDVTLNLPREEWLPI
ncbi:uncharacterized protein C20orf96-like [Polyodon spathula]|uniref:uncharacterized protein C20orf96-like n=1 Tax=Polyodon spathula TaxID=7913 RepID=UPI001B7ED66E|nr:uncharacterized protein C20orf96-like [Polyodon spathula]XP_041080265.1 uncharacterized protein C20orf96-like [Polyodon spathula]